MNNIGYHHIITIFNPRVHSSNGTMYINIYLLHRYLKNMFHRLTDALTKLFDCQIFTQYVFEIIMIVLFPYHYEIKTTEFFGLAILLACHFSIYALYKKTSLAVQPINMPAAKNFSLQQQHAFLFSLMIMISQVNLLVNTKVVDYHLSFLKLK